MQNATSSLLPLSRPTYVLVAFTLSLFGQSAIYLCACRYLFPTSSSDALKAAKARAWVLTAVSSLVMTLCSLPFVSDFVRHGGDVAKIERREDLARATGSFFVAYLILDLFWGWRHYRSLMNVLTGWIHHTAYTLLLSYILYVDFGHVFALAAFMELPTFILALAMLVPATRSDALFSTVFFLTRIAFHAVLIAFYSTTYGRLHGTQTFIPLTTTPVPSLVPALALLAAAPLHISWFTSSIRGQLKRARRARAAVAAALPSESTPPLSPFLLPARAHLISASSYFTAHLPSLSLSMPSAVAARSFRPSTNTFRHPIAMETL
ncbi:hypothetical protein RQP46_008173 [Phenoliferia psychrophenolica]